MVTLLLTADEITLIEDALVTTRDLFGEFEAIDKLLARIEYFRREAQRHD